MNYLTPAQVLFIHARLVAETDGATGLRDLGLLESAIARLQATFRGQDLYPDLFHKAAALMESWMATSGSALPQPASFCRSTAVA